MTDTASPKPISTSFSRCRVLKSFQWELLNRPFSAIAFNLVRKTRPRRPAVWPRCSAPMPSSSGRLQTTHLIILPVVPSKSSGMRPIRASIRFRPATVCPGGPLTKNIFPLRWFYETEFALAKAQLATQTPKQDYSILNAATTAPAAAPGQTPKQEPGRSKPAAPGSNDAPADTESGLWIEETSYQQPAEAAKTAEAEVADPQDPRTGAADPEFGFPPDWPDPSGLVPPPPRVAPQSCCPSDKPVLRHTQIFNGNDSEFTEALSSYYFFRDDARFGGWQTYLERSDDFIRFCCRMHIWEMFSARGGAGETRVVWRWPEFR